MVTIDVNNFRIQIFESTFNWEIYVGAAPILSGRGASIGDAKNQALASLRNYLDNARSGIKMAQTEFYDAVMVHAFRWSPSSTFTLYFKDSLPYFHDQIVREGDWILPDHRVVMSNDVFQKLFKRV